MIMNIIFSEIGLQEVDVEIKRNTHRFYQSETDFHQVWKGYLMTLKYLAIISLYSSYSQFVVNAVDKSDPDIRNNIKEAKSHTIVSDKEFHLFCVYYLAAFLSVDFVFFGISCITGLR